ncbi:MAG TPA: hypothetical protein VEI97_04810, partial [bacterium]|nr:hypothetical protein [bacterium]
MHSSYPATWVVYEPLTGASSPTGPPNAGRNFGEAATLLTGERCGNDCGKVLVVGGGYDSAGGGGLAPGYSTELYNPQTNLWELSEGSPILGGQNVTLADGRVLMIGITEASVSAPDRAAIYDPAARGVAAGEPKWRTVATPPLRQLTRGTMMVLNGPSCGANCGNVLIISGAHCDPCFAGDSTRWFAYDTAYLYDPKADAWSPTSSCACPLPWGG